MLISKTTSSGVLQGLRVMSVKDGKEIFLPIITLAEKCAWTNEDVLFCGAPKENLSGTVLPDEYYKGLFETSDRLVRIDLNNSSITEYNAEGFARGIDFQDVFTDKEGLNVFFRDQKTNFLYRFALP